MEMDKQIIDNKLLNNLESTKYIDNIDKDDNELISKVLSLTVTFLHINRSPTKAIIISKQMVNRTLTRIIIEKISL